MKVEELILRALHLEFCNFGKNKKQKPRETKNIYIVPPDAQQVGVSEAMSLLSLSLNSETTLIRDISGLEPFGLARERAGRIRIPHLAARLTASLPTAPGITNG